MNSTKNNVLVVGTGTIGEPLIGLLTRLKSSLGIDEVSFYKRTPLLDEKPKVNSLTGSGAKLAVNEDNVRQFEALGHNVDFTYEEALSRSSVVIDCTPAGNANKKTIYEKNPGKVYIAQGSEKGFGMPYALGISDDKILEKSPDYIQVVSCNTHAIARLLTTFSRGLVPRTMYGDFTCIRRANDVSQAKNFIPSPQVGGHKDPNYGTHHARDAAKLFETLGLNLDLFSSAMKINTQYMHILYFHLTVKNSITLEEVIKRLESNDRIAMTEKINSNEVFSFGRDYGHYGRILNQAVVAKSSLSVRNGNEIMGYCFTPQDGNSLLSSIAITEWFLYPNSYEDKIQCLKPLFFDEV